MRWARPRRGLTAPATVKADGHTFRPAHARVWASLQLRVVAREIRDLGVMTTARGLVNGFTWTDVRTGQVEAHRLTRQKFGAVGTVVDGHRFDSRHEARVYQVLKARHAAGEIQHLELHPVYEFIVNGQRIGKFTPDFRYRDLTRGGRLVVVDAKSSPTKTEAYGLRKRLLRALYDIDLVEM